MRLELKWQIDQGGVPALLQDHMPAFKGLFDSFSPEDGNVLSVFLGEHESTNPCHPLHTDFVEGCGSGCAYKVMRSSGFPRPFCEWVASLNGQFAAKKAWGQLTQYFSWWCNLPERYLAWEIRRMDFYEESWKVRQDTESLPDPPNCPVELLKRVTCTEPYGLYLMHCNAGNGDCIFVSRFDACTVCADFIRVVRPHLKFVGMNPYKNSPMSSLRAKRTKPGLLCFCLQ